LLTLELRGDSQLLRLGSGPGCSATEGSEGGQSLSLGGLRHGLESKLQLWSRSSLDWLGRLGSGLHWLRSGLRWLLDDPLWDLLRLGWDDPLRDLGWLRLSWGRDSLRLRLSLRWRRTIWSGWLNGEGVRVDRSLDWLCEGPRTLLTEWLEHKESVGRRLWCGRGRGRGRGWS